MAAIKSLTVCLNKNQDEDSAFTDHYIQQFLALHLNRESMINRVIHIHTGTINVQTMSEVQSL